MQVFISVGQCAGEVHRHCPDAQVSEKRQSAPSFVFLLLLSWHFPPQLPTRSAQENNREQRSTFSNGSPRGPRAHRWLDIVPNTYGRGHWLLRDNGRDCNVPLRFSVMLSIWSEIAFFLIRLSEVWSRRSVFGGCVAFIGPCGVCVMQECCAVEI